MTFSHPRQAVRSAFTLVELLVVIAIIAVLVSLTAAAVMKFLGEGDVAANTSEMRQLETAVAAFHRDFNLGKEYFPSRLVLCEFGTDYFVGGDPKKGYKSQVHADSLNFLQRMFPRLWSTNLTTWVDWNSNNIKDPETLLEGDQCLVFFLGGIQDSSSGSICLGFSTSGANPATSPTITPNRKGPYYEFAGGRLVKAHANSYFSYLDVYKKMPYAYFSSYNRRNGYNQYFKLDGKSDCQTMPGGAVWPYAESIARRPDGSLNLAPDGSGVRYQYPAKFQIISAGADQLFGPGSDLTPLLKNQAPYVWTPATAQTVLGQPPDNADCGQDDQANFYSNLLGRSE